MGTARIHVLAVLVALSCSLLVGCVLAEMHLTASPVPPWVDFSVKGLVDSPSEPAPRPPLATFATEPAANQATTLPSGQ